MFVPFLIFIIACCSLLYAVSFIRLITIKVSQKKLLALMIASLVIHAVVLIRVWNYQLTTVSLGNVASLFSWGFVVLGVWAYYLHNNRIALLVSQIVAAFLVWTPLLFDGQKVLEDSWGLRFHIILSIISYATLSFATLNAVLFLIQSYRLKAAKNMFGINVSLNYLQKIMIHFAWFGEILLTMSLLSGLLFISSDFFTTAVYFKLIITLFIWLMMAIIFIVRYYYKLRNQKFAMGLIIVNALLFIAYFGTSLLFSSFISSSY